MGYTRSRHYANHFHRHKIPS
ncbi:MAG: hypothetical protein U7126_16955 [Microcoleus sp.]